MLLLLLLFFCIFYSPLFFCYFSQCYPYDRNLLTFTLYASVIISWIFAWLENFYLHFYIHVSQTTFCGRMQFVAHKVQPNANICREKFIHLLNLLCNGFDLIKFHFYNWLKADSMSFVKKFSISNLINWMNFIWKIGIGIWLKYFIVTATYHKTFLAHFGEKSAIARRFDVRPFVYLSGREGWGSGSRKRCYLCAICWRFLSTKFIRRLKYSRNA